MTPAGLALGFAGMAALSLGMDRHYEQVFGGEPGRCRLAALRLFGALLLALALEPAVKAYGASVGAATWAAELTLGAVAVALLLSYAPRTLLPLAPASAALAAWWWMA